MNNLYKKYRIAGDQMIDVQWELKQRSISEINDNFKF